MPDSNDLTLLLHDWQSGDAGAGEELFRQASGELRRIAAHLFRNERGAHTLQPTAVVNEAYVRLLNLREMEWRDREHFYSFAATTMRRVLVDHARARNASKRDGRLQRTEIPASVGVWTDPVEVLALERALTALHAIDPERARLVTLRFYAGLTIEEVAQLFDVDPRTIKRRWQTTRGWLQNYFATQESADEAENR